MNKEKIVAVLADVSAFLTLLAAIPYELGAAAEFLPPETRPYIAGIGVFATLGLRLIKRYLEPTPLPEAP